MKDLERGTKHVKDTHKVSNEPKGGKERKTNCGVATSGRGSHWWIKQRRKGELKEQTSLFCYFGHSQLSITPTFPKEPVLSVRFPFMRVPYQPLTGLHCAADHLKLKEMTIIMCGYTEQLHKLHLTVTAEWPSEVKELQGERECWIWAWSCGRVRWGGLGPKSYGITILGKALKPIFD